MNTTSAYSWLVSGDMHYLSARSLYILSLYPVALHVSSTCIEMYLKCLLTARRKEFPIQGKDGHALVDFFSRAKIDTDNFAQFIDRLNDAYSEKYPDTWNQGQVWLDSLVPLDNLVSRLRNQIIKEWEPENNEQVDLLKIVRDRHFLVPEAVARLNIANSFNAFSVANQRAQEFIFFPKTTSSSATTDSQE